MKPNVSLLRPMNFYNCSFTEYLQRMLCILFFFVVALQLHRFCVHFPCHLRVHFCVNGRWWNALHKLIRPDDVHDKRKSAQLYNTISIILGQYLSCVRFVRAHVRCSRCLGVHYASGGSAFALSANGIRVYTHTHTYFGC